MPHPPPLPTSAPALSTAHACVCVCACVTAKTDGVVRLEGGRGGAVLPSTPSWVGQDVRLSPHSVSSPCLSPLHRSSLPPSVCTASSSPRSMLRLGSASATAGSAPPLHPSLHPRSSACAPLPSSASLHFLVTSAASAAAHACVCVRVCVGEDAGDGAGCGGQHECEAGGGEGRGPCVNEKIQTRGDAAEDNARGPAYVPVSLRLRRTYSRCTRTHSEKRWRRGVQRGRSPRPCALACRVVPSLLGSSRVLALA